MCGRTIRFIVLFSLFAGLPVRADPPMHLVPSGAKLLESGEHYVIFRAFRGGEEGDWILFDARHALTNYIAPRSNDTADTWAGMDRDTGEPVVFEGRHRAVAAAHGRPIRPELGGTSVPFWLIYSFTSEPFTRVSPDHGAPVEVYLSLEEFTLRADGTWACSRLLGTPLTSTARRKNPVWRSTGSVGLSEEELARLVE